MNLLVLDTSTDWAAIGVLTAGGAALVASIEATRRHGRDLLPCLGHLLRKARLAVGDLKAVGLGLGPGSYTGLRIGLTAAKTLVYATSADLVGFDSLEGMARNAPAEALKVHVVADAQRGDVYTADFTRMAPGAPLLRFSASRIEPLSAWSTRLDLQGLVIGPGLESAQIRAALPKGIAAADPTLNRPRGNSLLELAEEAWSSGRRDDLWTLEPLYLRRSAAEDQWDARQNP
jgi:tRNA threonylcarbamoyladenosine biosynthesis protein TsaB